MTEKPTTTLGARLRDARLGQGMTQDDLAAGQFSKSYVSAVELGKIRPSVNALRTLAARLDQPISFFLEEEDAVSEEERVATELADARYQLLAGNTVEARKVLEGVDTENLRSYERVNAMMLMAEVELAENNPLEATSLLDKAATRLSSQAPAEQIARIRHLTAVAYQQQGKANLAVELERKALAALGDADVQDVHLRLEILHSLAQALTSRPEEAQALAGDIAQASTAAADVRALARNHRDQADFERVSGRMGEGRRHINEAVALQEMLDGLRLAAAVAATFARLHANAGDNDKARRQLEQALQYTQMNGDLSQVVGASNSLTNFYLKNNDAEAAENLMQRTAELIDSGQISGDLQGQNSLNMARLHHSRGNHDDANKLFLQAIEQLERSDQREMLGQAYFQYGQALVAQGKAAEGADYLEKAYTASRSRD